VYRYFRTRQNSIKKPPTSFSGGGGYGFSQQILFQNVCTPPSVETIFFSGIGLSDQQKVIVQNVCTPPSVESIFFSGLGYGDQQKGIVQNVCTPPAIVTSGLILYLDAHNPASYPATGTTWTDLSSSSNNVSLINGPSYDSTNRYSILFDGMNDYAAKTTFINTGQDFTVSVWMYPTLLGSTQTNLIANSYNYTSGNGWFLCTDAVGVSNSFFLSLGRDNIIKASSANSVSINTWNYLTAVVKNGGQYIDLYKNGVLISGATTDNGAYTINYNYNDFSVGGGNKNSFKGNIGATQLYNRTLTADEILQNFNTLKVRYGY
jgi:hypothetical protein